MADGLAIAVIGMGLRFPGAESTEEFWDNLVDGTVSLSAFEESEVPPELARMAGGAQHMAIGGVVPGADRFDGDFFGISPKESQLLDPQHRIFLEVAHQAFENAAITPGEAVTGVFAGSAFPSYLLTRLWGSPATAGMGQYWLTVGNDKDHLSTRLAYVLGLTGPAISVQTACSTSLVAVHLACQSLAIGECDLAVAGASAIGFPQDRGYHVVEGGILSPDGVCRPFDEQASGTVPSGGSGVVLLKRLDDALADGDPIRAVIRGTALTNDGRNKLSYSSPSVPGQVRVIEDALRVAGVAPHEVGYVEAHGTATNLGDAIEVAALKQVMPTGDPCLLGAVKANLGHLDVAAGMAGLIKTVLALEHEMVPGTPNFRTPSPRLELDQSRFVVTGHNTAWPRTARPRFAGVSSFGLGGTNAHVVIEEAPAPGPESLHAVPALPVVIPLSAGTATALTGLAERLGTYPLTDLEAVARSLAPRRGRPHRCVVVAESGDEARAALTQVPTDVVGGGRVAFAFSGAGKHFAGQCAALLDEPAFAAAFQDARTALRAAGAEVVPLGSPVDDRSNLPTRALPLLFATQYALARYWEHLGVRADAVVGHSNGEFAAAVVAGALSLDGAARLVHRRSTLLERQAPGGMVAVDVDRETAESLAAHSGAFLAAMNTPVSHVFSGDEEQIRNLTARAQQSGHDVRPLGIATAAHSTFLEAAAVELTELAEEIPLAAAQVPFVSGTLGRITYSELAEARYWGEHLRRPVLFADAVAAVADLADVFVEIGPSGSVGPLLMAHPAVDPGRVVTSVPAERESVGARRRLRESAGRLWTAGVEIDLSRLLGPGPRVALPAADFDGPSHEVVAGSRPVPEVRTGSGPRIQEPVWESLPSSVPGQRPTGAWGVLGGTAAQRAAVAQVLPGSELPSRDLGDHAHDETPELTGLDGIVWITAVGADRTDRERFRRSVDLVRRGGAQDQPLRVVAMTTGLAQVLGSEPVSAQAALDVGPLVVGHHELSALTTLVVDVDPDASAPGQAAAVARALELELTDLVVAVRGHRVWARRWRTLDRSPAVAGDQPEVVLVTGGLGGIGASFARYMAAQGVARIALLGRSELPEPDDGEVSLSQRLLDEIAAEGAEVRYLPCDVTDPDALRAVVEEVRGRWGPIDTLVHAAGLPAGGLLQQRAEEEWSAVLAPKTIGTRNLSDVLAGSGLRRVLLCSSLDAVLGTVGQVDHVAANAFLDNVPASGMFADAVVTAVNWGAWREVGQAADTSRTGGLERWRQERLEQAIVPAEGARLAWEILRSDLPQVAVTAEDVDQAISEMRSIDLVELFTEPDEVDDQQFRRRPLPAHTYVEPEGPEEELLADQWSQVTGIAPIGAQDDYFAIGGHSLGAIALVSRLRQRVPFTIALTDVMERPTVRQQATWLREQLDQYVDRLTDDEVEARMAALAQQDGNDSGTTGELR